MRILRKPWVIICILGLIIGIAARAFGAYVTSEIKGHIRQEFALAPGGTQFIFDCTFHSDGVFRIADDVPMWDFCGCLGTDVSESLDDDEMDLAAFLVREHESTWTRVPPVRFAKTAVERRITTALERGTGICWTHLEPGNGG